MVDHLDRLEIKIKALEVNLQKLTSGVDRLEQRTYDSLIRTAKRIDGMQAQILILSRSAGLET